jgi:hypothetical protein
VYGFFRIVEEVPVRPEGEGRNCISDMFNVTAVKEIFWTVMKVREGKIRR